MVIHSLTDKLTDNDLKTKQTNNDTKSSIFVSLMIYYENNSTTTKYQRLPFYNKG